MSQPKKFSESSDCTRGVTGGLASGSASGPDTGRPVANESVTDGPSVVADWQPGQTSGASGLGDGERTVLEVLIITGLSGAGISTMLQVVEDLGFFRADGLPPAMIPDLYDLFMQADVEHFRGLALGVDFKHGAAVGSLTEALAALRGRGTNPVLVFLEASPSVLLRRYASTRRPHPLETEGLGLEQAMLSERERLASVREMADQVMDTSSYNLHELRHKVQSRWGQFSPRVPAMRVNITSFGFKYGIPPESDLVFDLRFLPNPFFVPELREKTGLDSDVAAYVFEAEFALEFRRRLIDFLLYLLPLYQQEGRYRLTLALGCTGGKHRSVAVAEYLAHALRQAGYTVGVAHRHCALG